MEYELGSGRLVPTVLAVLGLVGVVAGWRALARPGRTGSLFAVIAGLVSAVVGGLHAANSAGGLGTGNGLAGAVIAVALGLISIALGGLALVRANTAAGAGGRRSG